MALSLANVMYVRYETIVLFPDVGSNMILHLLILRTVAAAGAGSYPRIDGV